MRMRLTALALTAILAAPALGQPRGTGDLINRNSTTTVLPVWNNASGKIEALLVIEPSALAKPSSVIPASPTLAAFSRPVGADTRFTAGLGFSADAGAGIYCDGLSGLPTSLDSLASHCLFANAAQKPGSRGVSAQAGLQRGNARLDAQVGLRQLEYGRGLGGLPTGFESGPAGIPGARVNQQDFGLNGSLKLGSQGWISIGGTVAKARLIPSSQLPGALPPEWQTGSVSVSGGRGSVGGEVVGRVVDVPGQPSSFRSVGAGVTWQTPWRAKLSVGADNLMTRGSDPLGAARDSRVKPGVDEGIDGAVPYVRYEQDL